jgi:hypothetical protein
MRSLFLASTSWLKNVYLAKEIINAKIVLCRSYYMRAPPKIGKNMIFWRKIVISHTKYPKNFSASLRSAQFF